MKVIKYLENRRILLKETTRKIISQQGCFHNFLRILTAPDLPIMTSKLRPSSKRYFVTININQSKRWNFLKEYLWTSNDIINNF